MAQTANQGGFMEKRNISISHIDDGKTFDWGKTSEDYAKYRDIYPNEFYEYILKLGLCKAGSLFCIWDGYLLKIKLREKVKKSS